MDNKCHAAALWPLAGRKRYCETFPWGVHTIFLQSKNSISKTCEVKERETEGPRCEKANFTALSPHRKTISGCQVPKRRIALDISLLWQAMKIKHLSLHLILLFTYQSKLNGSFWLRDAKFMKCFQKLTPLIILKSEKKTKQNKTRKSIPQAVLCSRASSDRSSLESKPMCMQACQKAGKKPASDLVIWVLPVSTKKKGQSCCFRLLKYVLPWKWKEKKIHFL